MKSQESAKLNSWVDLQIKSEVELKQQVKELFLFSQQTKYNDWDNKYKMSSAQVGFTVY